MRFLLIALACAASVAAFGPYKAQEKLAPSMVENFTWSDPFTNHRLKKLDVACTAERTFRAREYLLHDLYEQEPAGLWPYADALKRSFTGRPYPGGWGGMDPHRYDRPLLRMDYADVPVAVREWIEDQERGEDSDEKKPKPGNGLFAVFERSVDNAKVDKKVVPPKPEMAAMLRPLDKKRTVVFAPGALYGVLPLWLAEDSDCKDKLLDLDRYTSKPKDGAVIAWTTSHSAPNRKDDERDMEFTIKAQVLHGKETHGSHIKLEKEEL